MNFKETKPIYVQIADRLCDEIQQGVFAEGARVPSVREYAALVEVNVNTVVKSYDHLVVRGVIFNKRGLGYFVEPGAARAIQEMRHEEFMAEYVPEFVHRMQLLGVSWDEVMEASRRLNTASTHRNTDNMYEYDREPASRPINDKQ